MKYISILPTKFIPQVEFSPDKKTLVLAHLIEKGNIYQKACLEFKKQSGELWLDNSFYELRGNMSIEMLTHKAKLIDADVVCLPDLPLRFNLKFIIESTILKMRRLGYKGKFMMCVFANNKDFKEDLQQFEILNSIKELNIIATPYVFRAGDEFKRPEFLDLIEKKVGVKNITKQIHLFGLNSIKNLKKENRPWISSIDGTMPFKCGYAKKKLPLSIAAEPKRPKNYFELDKLDKEQKECIDYNLNFIKELCK